MRPADFMRRLAASAYEALLLLALLIGVGFALLPLVAPQTGLATGRLDSTRPLYALSPEGRRLSAAAMFAVGAVYCGWFWSGGRQSLPMRTWRLALRTARGGLVHWRMGLLRYVVCWVGPALAIGSYQALQPSGYGRLALIALAFNYAWAIVDSEGLYFQDRVAGTRLVVAHAEP
jgi:hypothetical protein